MYYKIQKSKPGSNILWEDVGESHKIDDIETIIQLIDDVEIISQMWKKSTNNVARLFVWDFGKDNSLLLAIDGKITVWLYEKGGKITPLGEKKIEGVNVLDFLKQLENWQSIFDILKLLNN